MAEGTLVVGTITRDYVQSPAIALDGEMGGSASYFALAARHFGPVAVIAPVGPDAEAEARSTLAFADLKALSVSKAPTYQWHARRKAAGGDAETLGRLVGAAAGYRPRTAGADPGGAYRGRLVGRLQRQWTIVGLGIGAGGHHAMGRREL